MDYTIHTYHKYSILVEGGRRDALSAWLGEKNIASKVYYSAPCHAEPPYSHVRHVPGSLEASTRVSEEILSIPMHTELTPDVQDRVIEGIREFAAG